MSLNNLLDTLYATGQGSFTRGYTTAGDIDPATRQQIRIPYVEFKDANDALIVRLNRDANGDWA